MAKAQDAGAALVYGRDIALRDVDNVEAFLHARTSRLAGAEKGSDERQLARSVGAAVLHLTGTLRHSVSFLESAADDNVLLLRQQVRISWNALWALVSPWQWHDDYDSERWRSVKYWDAADESRLRGLLDETFAENRRQRSERSDGA
ncbi:hypothetical protein [Streptomyces sp. NPDC053755]|uniref:hypothetical protein n=1 Tax=Streptomyces sp. NPDC053755 TaxID=3155815 RepID=UPI003423CA96